MKIRVEEVGGETEEEGSVIRFSCRYGEGMGTCVNAEPEVGMLWDVEMNVLPVLAIGDNAFVSNEGTLFVGIEDDRTVFSVRVEGMDEEDVWLRLAEDFILVVEEIQGNVSVGDVLHVKLKPDELDIYTIGR